MHPYRHAQTQPDKPAYVMTARLKDVPPQER